MAVKCETNFVGCLMFVIFLMGCIGKYAYDAFRNALKLEYDQMFFMLPCSLGILGFLGWVLFDSAWLNFDDEEKDKNWKTSRWLKFSILFLPPIFKFFTKILFVTNSSWRIWGEIIAQEIQYFILISLAYSSLCLPYGSGLGRLFQPYTVPRSRIYTDAKGQKFELNFIGTTLSIVLIVLPCWASVVKPLGRLLIFISGNAVLKPPTTPDTDRFLSMLPAGRAIADFLVLILAIYSFVVIFVSCVKVTFFLDSSLNYLKFSPIPLTPAAIIFADNLCGYEIDSMRAKEWTAMLCFFMICFVAYASLVSPPDSLMAVLFQPHIPMIDIIEDLPDMTTDPNHIRPRTAVVFPEPCADSKVVDE